MSKCHLIVGATDVGKSYFIKNLLKKVPNKRSFFIHDINNEYGEFYNGEFLDFEEFAYKTTLLKNAVIVFEEATIFLDSRTLADKYVKETLALKKHTNNYIFMVFHAIAEIPYYVYRLSNYITVFKTNDIPGMSDRELRDSRLNDILKQVKENNDFHYCYTLKIY